MIFDRAWRMRRRVAREERARLRAERSARFVAQSEERNAAGLCAGYVDGCRRSLPDDHDNVAHLRGGESRLLCDYCADIKSLEESVC